MDAKIWILLAGCLLGSTAWAADVYRWTDAEGAVHFTDSPPHADAVPVLDGDAYSAPARRGLRSGEKRLYANARERRLRARREKAAANGDWFRERRQRAEECRRTDRALDGLRGSGKYVREREHELLRRRRELRCMGSR